MSKQDVGHKSARQYVGTYTNIYLCMKDSGQSNTFFCRMKASISMQEAILFDKQT